MPEINDRYMLFMTPYGGKYIALSFHAFHIWRDYFFVCEWYKGKVGLEISLVFIRGVLDIVIILMARMTFAILSSEKLANSETCPAEENCHDIYMTIIARTGAWDKSSMSWEIWRSGIASIKPSIWSANTSRDKHFDGNDRPWSSASSSIVYLGAK